MNAIDSDATNLCGLTPKQHIKLIKKVKATSPGTLNLFFIKLGGPL